ncbi:MAG: hypothetical protein U0586_16295 [Candidatus Brocadiaceae bacterium]
MNILSALGRIPGDREAIQVGDSRSFINHFTEITAKLVEEPVIFGKRLKRLEQWRSVRKMLPSDRASRTSILPLQQCADPCSD